MVTESSAPCILLTWPWQSPYNGSFYCTWMELVFYLSCNLSLSLLISQPLASVRLHYVAGNNYGTATNCYVDIFPLWQVLRKIEESDLGCGAGAGQNNVDVFQTAGLTFLTNANIQATQKLGKGEVQEQTAKVK